MKSPHTFQIPFQIHPPTGDNRDDDNSSGNESSDDDVDMLLPEQSPDQSSKPEARLEANVVVKPTQGFHKEKSLRNCIWRHFKFLHIGFGLFNLVFKKNSRSGLPTKSWSVYQTKAV